MPNTRRRRGTEEATHRLNIQSIPISKIRPSVTDARRRCVFRALEHELIRGFNAEPRVIPFLLWACCPSREAASEYSPARKRWVYVFIRSQSPAGAANSKHLPPLRGLCWAEIKPGLTPWALFCCRFAALRNSPIPKGDDMANVHFVGSVALDSPDEVFAAIGQHCGPYLKRIPDGEPGGRRLWISFQIPVLRANPLLAPVSQSIIPLKLAEGARPEDIHFGELGYAREARPRSELFRAAGSAGGFPAAVRFQVSLPTPWAVVMPFIQQPDARQVYPAYAQGRLGAVDRRSTVVLTHDLAIQDR